MLIVYVESLAMKGGRQKRGDGAVWERGPYKGTPAVRPGGAWEAGTRQAGAGRHAATGPPWPHVWESDYGGELGGGLREDVTHTEM